MGKFCYYILEWGKEKISYLSEVTEVIYGEGGIDSKYNILDA